MKKVCKRKSEETFAGTRGSDGVAPIPDFPSLARERGGSTLSVIQRAKSAWEGWEPQHSLLS
jgi:hypothetical protein